MADVFAPDERPQDEIDLSESAPMSEEWAISASTFLSTHMIRHFPTQRQQFKKYLTMQGADTVEREFWKNRLDRFARKLLVRQQDDGTLLFKAPTHTAKIRLILELYPDARFISIRREPYRVFNSTVKMEQKALPHCRYQNGNFDYLINYIIWRYKTMYQAYFEDIEYLSPEQLVEVSYKELDSSPVQTIQKIYKKLGIPGFDKYHPRLERYVSSISNYQRNSYPELSQDLKSRLTEEWGPYYERLGYHTKEKKGEFSNVF